MIKNTLIIFLYPPLVHPDDGLHCAAGGEEGYEGDPEGVVA